MPEVIAIETFLGRVDVRLNVIARDMAQYQHIYRHAILTLPHIADIESLMLISTVKNKEGEVVRQIPNEVVLRVAQNIDKIKGLLQDGKS